VGQPVELANRTRLDGNDVAVGSNSQRDREKRTANIVEIRRCHCEPPFVFDFEISASVPTTTDKIKSVQLSLRRFSIRCIVECGKQLMKE
jgi:hypothetical protein